MIVKFPFSRLPSRIFIRVRLTSYLSSIPIPSYIQTNPQNVQNPPNSHDLEAKIQSLKNKLHPETLIHVLSSTNDLNSSLRLFKWASLQTRFRHTIDTYSHIILRLGMACRVDEMEGFCNEMVKCGFLGTEQALLGLMDWFIRFRRIDEAFRVFCVHNSFRYKTSISLINSLLGALVEEKKEFKFVIFVYKEMVKSCIFPTIETLNYLLQALFDGDRVDLALDQYKRMSKKGCCPNSQTYEIMVSGLISKNLLDEALVVLNEIFEKDCVIESKLFLNTIPLLFRVNKEDLGLRLFEKMKTLKIVPDLSIYEALIEYFSKNLLMNDAINLFEEMISFGLKPSDYVFVDLVIGFCMSNKLSEAKQFLDNKQVTEVDPYNVLLEEYCHTDNFVEGLRLFKKMEETNIINSLSWNILIRYLSENQRNDIVYKALGRMIVSTSMPDSVTYSALIVGKCKSNELSDAVDLFHRVREERWVVDPSCYSTLIESLCQTEKIHEVVEVFCYMSYKKCTLAADTFSILIRQLCLIGKVEKVINLLPLAHYSGLCCSNTDYSIIMKSLSNLSKGDILLALFAKMVVEGCRLDSDAYNKLIKAMSEHHRVIECALFLNQMVNEGLLPDTEILADSLSFLAENFWLHMILPMVHKLFSNHKVFNPKIFNTLIKGLWKEGYRNEARWLLDGMLEKGWVPDARTHRLLISASDSEVSAYEKGNTKDMIVSILSEGFDER